jgi:hypothetical protein
MTRIAAAAPQPQPSAADVPITPVHPLPTVDPSAYRTSFSRWTGTVVGGGLAGFVGGSIAALGWDLLNLSGSAEGSSGLALIGIGAVAGLGIATATGAAILGNGKSSWIQHQKDDIAAKYGTSTTAVAREAIQPFDHDGDGKIDLVNPSGLQSDDERLKQESRTGQETSVHYDVWDNKFHQSTQDYTEKRTLSAAGVWEAANTSPKDDAVTLDEVAHLMAQYDTDKSGSLTTAEQQAFSVAHPLKAEDWSR